MADFYGQLDQEAGIITEDFYTKLDQEAEKPIGIRETLKHVDMIDVLEHIPVPFNPYQGAEKVGYLQAKERLAENQYEKYAQARYEMTPMGGYTMVRPAIDRTQDLTYVKQHENWQRELTTRGVTTPQAIAHGILDVFPWVADIAISGGVRKPITAAITKAIKSPKLAIGAALLANATVASAMQPARFSETAATVKIEDPDLSESQVYTKAIKRLYIENLSEMTGQYITKGALALGKRVPFTNKLIEKTGAVWRKMFNKSADDLLQKISTVTGVNDLFGEIGEERVNTILQGLVDADDFGAGKDAGPFERIWAGLKQDAANIGIEIPILAIPAAGRYVAVKALTRGVSQEAQITPDEAAQIISDAAQQIDPKATPEKQQEQLTETVLDEIEKAKVQKIGLEDVTDQASLEKVGNAIAKFLGVEGTFEWVYSTRPVKRKMGGIKTLDSKNKIYKITINSKHPGHQGINGQKELKDTIIEEFAHIIKKPFRPKVTELPSGARIVKDKIWDDNYRIFVGKKMWTFPAKDKAEAEQKWLNWQNTWGRRKVHHPELKQYIADSMKQLFTTRKEKAAEVPVKPEIEPLVKPKRLTRKKALKIGHDVPEILGWTDKQRRDFIEELTGQRSLKDLKMAQLRVIVDTLDQEMRERGLIYEPPVLPTKELIETLKRTKKVTAEHPIKEMNRRGINKLGHSISKKIHTIGGLLFRTERFLEGLDGHKEGVFYNTFWTPVNDACNSIDAIVNQEVGVFYSEMENQDIDTVLWMGAIDKIPGTEFELTASQRIGVYTLSKNENGLRYLAEGMGLTKKDIAAIIKFMGDKETQMAEWLLNKYEAQWPILQRAAAQAGVNLKTLKKEFRYAPIIRTDTDLEAQEDFLSDLAEPFRREGHKPEAGMLERRKAGAIGRIELDGLVCYLHNIARVQRFITMAPLANKLSKILNNKDFKVALNDRTYGQGSKLINSWLKDAVKGSSAESTTFLSKTMAIMRINGIVYAIGYNIPSSLRQTISGITAIAVDPLMMKYMPMNILKAMTPEGYRTMEAFVYERAPALQHRNMDRDIRRRWNKVTLKRNLTFTNFSKRMGKMFGSVAEGDLRTAYMYYKSGQPFSRSALRWIKFMDKHTVIVSWKSFYDAAIQKEMNEQDAIHFTNKWIGRTQPMGNVQWLPQFFRDGPLEKLVSTFQNFVNQFGNFYYYDVYQAKKTGEIGMGTVAHRIMWSYILPAVLFGMVGRARPPRDWKELMIDFGTYPIAPLMIVGRLIDRMIRGWGNSGTIAETAPEAAVTTGRAIMRGDVKRAIKGAATTIAALKGVPPTAQMIRTTEGIIDLAAGTTEDPRRLIYSKWALEQGKTGQPVYGTRRGKRTLRRRTGKPRRR